MKRRCVSHEALDPLGLLATEEGVFEAHRSELVAKAAGEFVLIRGEEIAGVFPAEMDAIAEGYRRYGNTPFLVHRIQTVDDPVVLSTPLVRA